MRELYRNFSWYQDGSVQSMLVENGIVVERGSQQIEDPNAVIQDLSGRTLLPKFIDCHCHILPTGQDLQKLHLGDCQSQQDVLDAIRDLHQKLDANEWLLAVHYDQNKFENGEHLHRSQLDAISEKRPILLRHVNGHAGVANSAALTQANVHSETPDPAGGVFVRDSAGDLTGVLLEDANNFVTSAVPEPTLEQLVEAILLAGEKMAGLGICCATDMLTGRGDVLKEIEAYRIAADRGCKIELRLFVLWSKVFGPRGIGHDRLQEEIKTTDGKSCRIEGIKIFADGAIGSATAAIYGKYDHERQSQHGSYSGQLIYTPEKLSEMVRIADGYDYRIAIHTIGDYCTDLVMNAYERTTSPKRHRIEHAMLLSDEQIERMARLGSHCSMQPEFLMHFGRTYMRQLGEERASMLKRLRSVKDAGIPLSLSSDRPIVAGDPRDGIKTAYSRPDGFTPDEQLTRTEAIEGYTQMAAVANGDEARMGSLAAGQIAEFLLEDL